MSIEACFSPTPGPHRRTWRYQVSCWYQLEALERLICAAIAPVLLAAEASSAAELWPPGGALAGQRSRIIVSTDMGGSDPDDFQSMVHYLVYADVFDTEGLISSPPGAGRKKHILEVIDAYEKDYESLKSHSPRFPTPAALRAVTKQGAIDPAPETGYAHSTEGSNWIIQQTKRDDPRPLYILVWGSITDVAQAIHDEPAIKERVRVYSIGSWNTRQDPASRDYLYAHHPDLWWIEADTTFRGMYIGGKQNGDLDNRRFVDEHVKGHGALGDLFFGKKKDIKMGDSPSVLYLLRGNPDDPAAESWGGRFERYPRGPHRWKDLSDPQFSEGGRYPGAKTVNRWREDYLRHWQQRMQWAAAPCSQGSVVNAHALQLAVVVDPAAGETERYAAAELQRYLTRITGTKVMAGPNTPPNTLVLRVGGAILTAEDRADLRAEGYALRSTPAGLALAGVRPRSTLYAVYDFLERLGCRWFFFDRQDEIIPHQDAADVARVARSGLDVKERPDFALRMRRFLLFELGPASTPLADAVMKEQLPDLIDWLTKNRMNILQIGVDHTPRTYTHWKDYRALFPEMRKRDLTIGVGGHCMYLFLQGDVLDRHPDWWPMIDGKRQRHGQFCTRNEEAVRHCIRGMVEFLKDNPEVEYLAVWPNDTGGWCECPLCKGTSTADRVIEFFNRATLEIKQAAPHVCFAYLAYGTHMTPPDKGRPVPEMHLTLCTHGRDLAVPFSDSRTSEEFRSAFAKWRDLTRQAGAPFIFHEKYARMLWMGFHAMPVPIMQEDCRWFRQQRLDGFDLPASHMGRHTRAFNAHVLARLLWNADADVEGLYRDFFEKCYGKLALEMRRVYEKIERVLHDLNYGGKNFSNRIYPQGIGREQSPRLRQYAENARKELTEALDVLLRLEHEAADELARRFIRRFTGTIHYCQLEWAGLAALCRAAAQLQRVDQAQDRKTWDDALKVAAAELDAATMAHDERMKLIQTGPENGLYWNVDFQGPWNVYTSEDIDHWRKEVTARAEMPFETRPRKVWQIGSFSGSPNGLGESWLPDRAMRMLPKRVTCTVPADWAELEKWPFFPPAHWPRELGHAATIDIRFDADPGFYVLTVGQIHTDQSETVSVLVDGKRVGSYTTVKYQNHLHRVPFVLRTAGPHTLTLDDYGEGGGYLFDALMLERLP